MKRAAVGYVVPRLVSTSCFTTCCTAYRRRAVEAARVFCACASYTGTELLMPFTDLPMVIRVARALKSSVMARLVSQHAEYAGSSASGRPARRNLVVEVTVAAGDGCLELPGRPCPCPLMALTNCQYTSCC